MESCDAANESRKKIRLADLGVKAELEGHVGNAVLVVVNQHLVEHTRIEGEIVGPVGGFEQRVYVQIKVT